MLCNQSDLVLMEKGGTEVLAEFRGFEVGELNVRRGIATVKDGLEEGFERVVLLGMLVRIELERRGVR